MYLPPLAGFDMSDDVTLDFNVIAYRGAPVFSESGWQADVTSRGGVITNVPGGFFHDIPSGRFGSAAPYIYELPPVWLLTLDGVDLADQEFLEWVDYQGVATEAENQRQSVVNMVTGAAGGVSSVVASLPSLVKWGAIGVLGLIGLEAVRSFAPRGNPRPQPRRR